MAAVAVPRITSPLLDMTATGTENAQDDRTADKPQIAAIYLKFIKFLLNTGVIYALNEGEVN